MRAAAAAARPRAAFGAPRRNRPRRPRRPRPLPLLHPAAFRLPQVHFAEEWNELHHLQIMEALGGDRRWVDRFAGEHAAVFYYWVRPARLVAPFLKAV